ncbi:MAG: DUF429 domain-containing protein [Candidatus Hadarchaeales archaeon]
MGLDLAGVPKNPSGVALLRGHTLRTSLVYEDQEIEELCKWERVKLLAVDAPLSLPDRGSLRPSDLLLIRMGFRVFPPTFSGMRSLTLRGISLKHELGRRGIEVIEVHPRTSGRILFGTPCREEWAMVLARKGWVVRGGMGVHELDACVSALTGLLHLKGKTVEVGEKGGKITLPATSWVPCPEARACTDWKLPPPLPWRPL